jgi:hypothetical protein
VKLYHAIGQQDYIAIVAPYEMAAFRSSGNIARRWRLPAGLVDPLR